MICEHQLTPSEAQMQLAADKKGLRDAIVFLGPTQEPLGPRQPKVSPGSHCAQTLLRLNGTVQDEDCSREGGEGRDGDSL